MLLHKYLSTQKLELEGRERPRVTMRRDMPALKSRKTITGDLRFRRLSRDKRRGRKDNPPT
jgi:hypothetical protein